VRRRPTSTLFPYTTLFRSGRAERERGLALGIVAAHLDGDPVGLRTDVFEQLQHLLGAVAIVHRGDDRDGALQPFEIALELGLEIDRKSTRLNSSHVKISYA